MKTSAGFTFIELLLAVIIAGIFLPALSRILSLSMRSSSQGEKYSQAYVLGQQGMEAVYALKSTADANWDWTNTPINTTATTYYQPSETAGVWSLGAITSNPIITQGSFTRTVQISAVNRCGIAPDLTICPGGAPDATTRKIDVAVFWPEAGGNQTVTISSYVTQH